MILSNVEIQRALDDSSLVITPEPSPRFPTAGVAACPYQTSSVDLRLGEELSVYKPHRQPVIIDLHERGFAKFGATAMEPLRLTTDQPFVLQPRRFVLGQTHERVALPLRGTAATSLAARVEGKSSYARCGMLVHFTAPTIHAGFEGTITLEIINLGEYPISLHPLMPICQLIIEEVRGVPFKNDSQFQGQSRTVG